MKLTEIKARPDPVVRSLIKTDALQAVVVARDGAVLASVAEVSTTEKNISVSIALSISSSRFGGLFGPGVKVPSGLTAYPCIPISRPPAFPTQRFRFSAVWTLLSQTCVAQYVLATPSSRYQGSSRVLQPWSRKPVAVVRMTKSERSRAKRKGRVKSIAKRWIGGMQRRCRMRLGRQLLCTGVWMAVSTYGEEVAGYGAETVFGVFILQGHR